MRILIDEFSATWTRILEILNENSFYMNYVNFWGHSDPDMLEVGNGALTPEETRSHFALWAAMKSPLLIGTDLTNISSDNVAILKNQYLLAFNQDDQYGAPAAPYKWGVNPDWTFNASFPAQYWSGQFKQGTLVAILNLNNSETQMSADWGEIPGLTSGAAYQVTEAWSGTAMGCLTGGLDIQVPAHDTAVLVVGSSCTPTKKRGRNLIKLPFDG
jgi:alpha-galactosidase